MKRGLKLVCVLLRVNITQVGAKATPAKVLRIPAFPHLAEDNVRKGFLEDGQYQKLIESCPELWFRAIVECGRTYGWRISEVLKLRANQVDMEFDWSLGQPRTNQGVRSL